MTTSFTIKNEKDNTIQGDWREIFLQRILVISAIVGLLALIPAVISSNNLVLQSIYIGVYAILAGSILIRLPYLIKASIFVALPLVLGISSFTETGINGDSSFFLLAYITFSVLLIGPRGGVLSIALSEAIYVVTGFLVLTGRYSLSNTLAVEGALEDWISAGAVQLMISLVVFTGLRMLQNGFEQARTQIESMLNATRESQAILENRVSERTKELARKTSQMNASTIVAHQAASIQDLDQLLNSTVNLISKQFGYYHAAIFLINPRGDYVTLQAASSEGGKRLVERGYRLRIGIEGIVGFVAAEKKHRVALDVGEDAYYFDSPDLPDTRSELALPLIVRDKLIGVLDMQSVEVGVFNFDEIEILQTLADQIAIAIENARLLTESQLTISQLEIISNENIRRNWQMESSSKKPIFHYSATGVRSIDQPNSLKGKNLLTVPLLLRGQKIGKISLQRKDEFQNWTNQEETVAKEIANQTALAVENIRLVERTRDRANREQSIANMTSRIRETLDLETVLRTSARELQKSLSLEQAEVRLITQANPGNSKESEETTTSILPGNH